MLELIKKHRRLIIVAIVLLILIIIIISLASKGIKNAIRKSVDKHTEDGPAAEAENYISQWSGKINEVRDFSDYYVIKNAINKYYLNYAYMYSEDNSDYYYSSILLDILPKDYIESKQLTKENIKDKLNEIGESEIYLLNAYVVNDFNNKKVFYVDFLIRDIVSIECAERKVVIVCNTENNTFTVYPNDYMESIQLPNMVVGEEWKADFDINFEANNNNTYGSGTKSIRDYASDTYNNYRKLMLYAPEKAYEVTQDSDFNSYQDFKNYIDNNRMDIFLMTFGDYDLVVNDGYEDYTVYDQNGKINIVFDTKSLVGHKFSIK